MSVGLEGASDTLEEGSGFESVAMQDRSMDSINSVVTQSSTVDPSGLSTPSLFARSLSASGRQLEFYAKELGQKPPEPFFP
jgi:hypothetical protein